MPWDPRFGLRRFKNVTSVKCKPSKYGNYKCEIHAIKSGKIHKTGSIYTDILEFPTKYKLKSIKMNFREIASHQRTKFKNMKEVIFDNPLNCRIGKVITIFSFKMLRGVNCI